MRKVYLSGTTIRRRVTPSVQSVGEPVIETWALPNRKELLRQRGLWKESINALGESEERIILLEEEEEECPVCHGKGCQIETSPDCLAGVVGAKSIDAGLRESLLFVIGQRLEAAGRQRKTIDFLRGEHPEKAKAELNKKESSLNQEVAVLEAKKVRLQGLPLAD